MPYILPADVILLPIKGLANGQVIKPKIPYPELAVVFKPFWIIFN